MKKFLGFLKIFLISASSVIGVMGLAVGISYLAGGFDTPKIEPQDLVVSLKENETNAYIHNVNELHTTIYAGSEFYLVINTTTEDCTMKDLQLSFENHDSPAVSGKISDGTITIPNQVKIGVPFKVEFNKTSQTFNLDTPVTLDWIKGGISTIIAQSKTNITLLPVSIEIAVDVPVYAVELEAYPLTTDATKQDAFAVGSDFEVRAKFYPEDSKYRFSQKDDSLTLDSEEQLKTVYISQNVTELQYYTRKEGASSYLNQFSCKKIGDVTIDGYVFTSAMNEYYMEKVYNDVNAITPTYSKDQIYEGIRNSLVTAPIENTLKSTISLSFEKVSHYSYSVTSAVEEIKESTSFTYFANYNSSVNGGNLGITFTSDNPQISMQHEIENVGVSIVKRVEDTKSVYSDAKFSEYASIKYLAYKHNENNTYINPIEYDELLGEQKLSYTASALDNLDGVDVNFKDKFIKFYLPKVSSVNIDASLWQLSIDEIGEYSFVTYYFGSESGEIKELPIYYVNFSIVGGVTAPVRWLNTTEQELVVVYDAKGENETIKEYDVKKYGDSSNVFIPATNEYTTVKYFIYSDYGFIGTDNISNYVVSTPAFIDNDNFSEIKLYEIEDGIIKFVSGKEKQAINKTFNVIFATVKTYANGEIRYKSGKYVVDQISSNENGSYTESIPFKVVNSLYEIQGNIDILKEDKAVAPVVGKDDKTGEDIKNLAIKQNTENVFTVTLDTKAEKTLLDEELHSNGQIRIIAKSLSGINLSIEDFLIQSIEGKVITFSTRPISADKIAFNLYISYERTGALFLVNSFKLGEEEGEANNLEIYSGEAKYGYFGSYEEKQDGTTLGKEDEDPSLAEVLGEDEVYSTVKVEVEISTVGGSNTNLETTYTVYTLVDESLGKYEWVKTAIFDEDSKIKVGFKDEYGFDVLDVGYSLESTDEQILKVQNGRLIFIQAGTATLNLKLNDEVVDSLIFEYKESPVQIYKLTKLKEEENPQLDSFEEDGEEVYNLETANGKAYTYEELTVEVYGAKSRQIKLIDNKLIDVSYCEANPDYDDTDPSSPKYLLYELGENITYKLLTNVSADLDLSAMLEFKFDEFDNLTEINIKQHFEKDARIRVEATIPELNFVQIISIVIRPNITISVDPILEEMPDGYNAEDYINTATGELYKGVYGKTGHTFKITTRYVIESAVLADKVEVKVIDYEGREVEGTITGNELVITGKFEDSYSFKAITYKAYIKVETDTIGLNGTIEKTNYNAYSFNQNMNYYINPNIKLVSNTAYVDKNGIDIFKDGGILEIERIVGEEPLASSTMSLKQLKDGVIYDTSDPECDFVYDNSLGKLTLKANNLDKPITLNVLTYIQKSGEVQDHNIREGATRVDIENLIGMMVSYYYKDITILPRIVNSTDSKRLVEYNGRTYFYFVEGETLSKDDILSNFIMHKASDVLDSTTADIELYPLQSGVWSKTVALDGYVFASVNKISGVSENFTISIKSDDYYLSYPFIILPFDYPVFVEDVKYYKENEPFEIGDLKNLIDYSYLRDNEVFLNINLQSGTRIRLDKIFNSYIAGSYDVATTTYTPGLFTSFGVRNPDTNDVNIYATVTLESDGWYLNAKLTGENREIILTARKGEAGANTFEIPVRINIISDVELKVFYPYDSEEGATEYVTFNGQNSVSIDMNEVQSQEVPNKSIDGKRYELFVAGRSAVNNDDITENIAVSYAVKNVNIGSGYAKNPENYARFNGSVLTIYNYNNQNSFIVNVILTVGDNVCSEEYSITVIDGSELYSLITTTVTTSSGTFDGDSKFTLDYTPSTTISGFKLRKTVGQVNSIVNNELRYYIYNGQETVVDYENTLRDTVKINNFDTIVDIDAKLLVYTKKGPIKTFDYFIKSTHTINLNDSSFNFSADTEYIFNDTLTLQDSLLPKDALEILNIEIKSLTVDSNNATITDNKAVYINANGSESFVEVDNLNKKLIVSPFMKDGELSILVKFLYEDKEYELVFNKKVIKDLASNYPKLNEPNYIKNGSNDFNGGQVWNIADNTLFEGKLADYNLAIEAVTGNNLVKFDGITKVVFANTAAGGEVILKFVATHIDNENYYLESYAKFVVNANLRLTINYPNIAGETQTSEVIQESYEFRLSDAGVLPNEDARVILTNLAGSPVAYAIKVTSSQYVNMFIGASTEPVVNASSGDTLVFKLQSGKASGQISLGLYVYEDLIGTYVLYVKPNWTDIITSNLRNEDGTLNDANNPETYFNGVKLDVADLLTEEDQTEEEKLKQFVFGYNDEEYLNKSTFNYFVNSANVTQLPNTFFECEIADKDIDITIGENSDTNIVITIKTASEIEVGKYYVKFIFDVTFNKEVITLYPTESGFIKTLYDIKYNDKYTLDVKKYDENSNYKLVTYTKSAENPLIWNDTPNEEYMTNYKNFLTVEQNGVNIQAHGAPNSGVKIDFTVIISCGENKVEKLLSCIILPNYVVEITDDQPFVVDASKYADNADVEFVLATTDVATSAIIVTRGDGSVTNLVVNSDLFTCEINNPVVGTDFHIKEIAQEFGQLSYTLINRGSSVRTITLNLIDVYDYKFSYVIKFVPKEENMVSFKSANYTLDELVNLQVHAEINGFNISKDNFSSYVFGPTENIESMLSSEINPKAKELTLPMPAVTNSTSYSLIVRIERDDIVDEIIEISTNIIVRNRYDLAIDDSYISDGAVYLRDGEEFNAYDYFNVIDSTRGLVYGRRELTSTKSFNMQFEDDQADNSIVYVYQVPKEDVSTYSAFELIKSTSVTVEYTYSTDKKWDKLKLEDGEFIADFNDLIPANFEQPELYRYFLKISYGATEKVIAVSYSQIVEDGEKIKFDKPADLDEVDGSSTIKLQLFYTKLSYNISNLTLKDNYKISATQYYIPLQEIMFNELTASNYYYYFTNGAESIEYNTFINGADASFIVNDKLFTIEVADTTTGVDVLFYDGDERFTLNIPNQTDPIKLTYSMRVELQKKGDEYLDDIKLFTGEDSGKYYRGLTVDALIDIKNFNIEGLPTEDAVQTVDIAKNVDGTVWLDMTVRPLFAYMSFVFKGLKLENGKEFGTRTVAFRALPKVVDIANDSGIIDRDGDDSRIVKTISAAHGSSISIEDWANNVYVMDHKTFIYKNGKPVTLKDYMEGLDSKYSFSFAIQDATNAEIDEDTGLLTPSTEFDYIHGHISIDIYLTKHGSSSEDVYTVKVGYVRIMPRIV